MWRYFLFNFALDLNFRYAYFLCVHILTNMQNKVDHTYHCKRRCYQLIHDILLARVTFRHREMSICQLFAMMN